MEENQMIDTAEGQNPAYVEEEYPDDAVATLKDTSVFLKTNTLVGKRTACKWVRMSRMPNLYSKKPGDKKDVATVEIEGLPYKVDVNSLNYNFMVKNFGPLISKWKGKSFYLTARVDTKEGPNGPTDLVRVSFTL